MARAVSCVGHFIKNWRFVNIVSIHWEVSPAVAKEMSKWYERISLSLIQTINIPSAGEFSSLVFEIECGQEGKKVLKQLYNRTPIRCRILWLYYHL